MSDRPHGPESTPDRDPAAADTISIDDGDTLPSAGGDAPSSTLPPGMGPGSPIGRFTVLDVIGSGGMGVVLLAYDPKLDRRVALKLLRASGRGSPEEEMGRLLQEARAMARLSHPNVIAVYDVGTIEERVFVAMEYIEGTTLGRWLAERDRPWQEIVAVFAQAGRALAAGHRAGLVHRDFKPENVLVGTDGRAFVIDFGLARFDEAPDPRGEDTGSFQHLTPTPIPTRVSATESIFGTPQYMAPEQHERSPVDGRADQFAFCVALYEALYGRPPFAGETYLKLAENVLGGVLRPPPPASAVPDRVRDAILRGLSVGRKDRFPAMEELLAALEEQPARRSRALLLGLGAAAAGSALALAVVLLSGGGKDDPCSAGDTALEQIWNRDVANRMRTSFDATGRPHAGATYERVAARLDDYATRWRAAWRDACEATHVRREQSEQALDLRMGCLRQRRLELGHLTSLLAGEADPELVDRAVGLAPSSSAIDACADADRLAEPAPGSSSPEELAEVTELHDALTELELLGRAELHAAGLERLEPVLERVRAGGHAHLEGRFLLLQGLLLDGAARYPEAEEALRAAIQRASESADDETAARAWIRLVWVVGVRQARVPEATALRLAAETAIARAGGDASMRADLLVRTGQIHELEGDYAQARSVHEQALALRLGDEDLEVAAIQQRLGWSLIRLGRHAEATVPLREALATYERLLGPDHPQVANTLTLVGNLDHGTGRFDEALASFSRAQTIVEGTLGADHPQAGALLLNIGETHRAAARFEEALRHQRRAAEVFAAHFPEGHPYRGYAEIGITGSLVGLGRAEEAVEHGERALAIVAELGDPHYAAECRFVLAQALWGSNRDRRRALMLARAAHDALDGSDDPNIVRRRGEIEAWLSER